MNLQNEAAGCGMTCIQILMPRIDKGLSEPCQRQTPHTTDSEMSLLDYTTEAGSTIVLRREGGSRRRFGYSSRYTEVDARIVVAEILLPNTSGGLVSTQ